ncbi:MAG: hypothetical protein HYY93_07915 [Planctomycetes bacterium]|nr:hypothetical protein [Planctomycetota bacterium]
MGSELDLLIGRHAVARTWVSEGRVADAVAQQERETLEGKPERLIGAILVERGDLTPEQLDRLLDDQARALLSREDTLLGATLVRNGLARQTSVDWALAEQRLQHPPRRLGEILLERGEVTLQGLQAAALAQARMSTKKAGDPPGPGI